MPWRGPEVPGEFPTLGWQVADWIQERCVIPDGDQRGQPLILTEEMVRFLLWYYRLDPDRASRKWSGPRFHFERGGQLVRPQKWGKGPFSGAIICAEAEGPVVPDGWDADGEPVGRPWATPHIQITAISEDQTDNVYRALLPMIELGDLVFEIPDTGLGRINLTGGGIIEPVTASATSRLGQRVTFVLQDETHSYTERNRGRKLSDTQRRNLSGMGGRFLETTNAWDPTEQSTAQLTNENPVGVHVDYPSPPAGSVRNKRERRKVLRAVYGDSVRDGETDWGKWKGWVDLDRIDLEIESLLESDPPQAERFFLNRVHAGESVAFDLEQWHANTRYQDVPERSLIVIGVDGARFDDALAIVATDVATNHQWPIKIIERPDNADDDYEHDFEAADGAMLEAFTRFDVWRIYVDPQRIELLFDRWQGRWTDRVVLPWYMNRPRQVAYAVRSYRVAISAGDVTNDGDLVMARHIGNARRMPLEVKDEDGRPMFSIQKDRRGSPNKIDAAAAGVLSHEARGDAIADGALQRQRLAYAPRRIY